MAGLASEVEVCDGGGRRGTSTNTPAREYVCERDGEIERESHTHTHTHANIYIYIYIYIKI